MKAFGCAVWRFVKGEVVLCIAVLLAIISCFIVPPSAAYADYIDVNTISLLFCLMAAMKGFQRAGLFSFLAGKLLAYANTTKKLMIVLVFAPFFFSMAVTNDVALITFVPFAMIVLRSAGQQRLVVPTAVLQTVAANLGSMLTPIGNPQNLYLFNTSGMGFGAFVLTMLPYVLLSGAGIMGVLLFFKSSPVQVVEVPGKPGTAFSLCWPAVCFAVSLFALFGLIPSLVVAAATLLFLAVADHKTLAQIDYSLLLTFVALFVFIGNMGNIQAFRSFLISIIGGNEMLVAVLASQVISNVPAALLLSGFSTQWQALIVGCNLGGLGTLIASMASLITYKCVAGQYPQSRLKYLGVFTIYNIAFLAALIGLSFLIALSV